jgi:hypothetical protein
MSRPGHDAYDANGDVQIKMTAGTSVAMYATCDRLVVLRVPCADSVACSGHGITSRCRYRGSTKSARPLLPSSIRQEFLAASLRVLAVATVPPA